MEQKQRKKPFYWSGFFVQPSRKPHTFPVLTSHFGFYLHAAYVSFVLSAVRSVHPSIHPSVPQIYISKSTRHALEEQSSACLSSACFFVLFCFLEFFFRFATCNLPAANCQEKDEGMNTFIRSATNNERRRDTTSFFFFFILTAATYLQNPFLPFER